VKTSYGAPKQALVGARGNSFEDAIELSIDIPAISPNRGRGAIDNQFLELRNSSSLPELVCQSDNEFLESLRDLSPLRVRPADARNVCGCPVLQE
jgi:hypothetical protein